MRRRAPILLPQWKVDPAGGNASSSAVKEEKVLYERITGVWTGGRGICSSGFQKGGLMPYVEEMQCCMMEQVVADKLVSSAVFTKGQDGLSLCVNRVLSRVEGWPDVGER